MSVFQKIMTFLGPADDPRRSGSSISSSGSESPSKPVRSQPIRSSVEIGEPTITPNGEIRSPKPPGEGWVWKRGEWCRPVPFSKRCGHPKGAECPCDDPDREAREYRAEQARRRGSLTKDNPFSKYGSDRDRDE